MTTTITTSMRKNRGKISEKPIAMTAGFIGALLQQAQRH
ncbi:MAG: hypothetical protein ACI9TP_001897 [Candidatus Azotimanducaceae bacterium]|jgi:hypothetical protein